MKCEIQGTHIVATSKYDIPLLSSSKSITDILAVQKDDNYVQKSLLEAVDDESSDEDSDLCGICQISFNHHCNHCLIKISLPYKNEVNIHKRQLEPDEYAGNKLTAEMIASKDSFCPLSNGVCNHFFHLHCIQRWLDQGSSGNKCPMCRQNYFAVESDKESSEDSNNLDEMME